MLKDIFKITVSAAKELGAIGLEQLSIDGSKLKACASNNSTVTKEQIDIIEQYVNTELKETDKKKIKSLIAKYYRQIKKDEHNRIYEIKDTIKEARKELEENELDKVSLTDPEARFMKNKVEINKFDKRNFKYNERKDTYICPEGKSLVFQREGFDKRKKKNLRLYKGMSCNICQNHKHCTKRKDGIRYVKMYPFEKERKEMAKKMQTQKAKKTYKERKEVVERIIGHYKDNLGFREFLTRSLDTVRNEFNLVCAAHNLKKIWILLQKKKEKIGQVIHRRGNQLAVNFFRNFPSGDLIVGQPV